MSREDALVILLGAGLGIMGIVLVAKTSGELAFGVFLMLWANNLIERARK